MSANHRFCNKYSDEKIDTLSMLLYHYNDILSRNNMKCIIECGKVLPEIKNDTFDLQLKVTSIIESIDITNESIGKDLLCWSFSDGYKGKEKVIDLLIKVFDLKCDIGLLIHGIRAFYNLRSTVYYKYERDHDRIIRLLNGLIQYQYKPTYMELNSYPISHDIGFMEYLTKHISSELGWVDVMVKNDDTLTLEFITKKGFDYCTPEFYMKLLCCVREKNPFPIDIELCKKLINNEFPYKIVSPVLKSIKRDIKDEDVYSIIKDMMVRKYQEGDGSITSEFRKFIVKNEEITMEIIEWLCNNNDTQTYIKGLHKQVNFKFTQKHLTLVLKKSINRQTLIEYVINNSENIKITKALLDIVIEQKNVPPVMCLLLNYLKD